jgi:hypothetical protein
MSSIHNASRLSSNSMTIIDTTQKSQSEIIIFAHTESSYHRSNLAYCCSSVALRLLILPDPMHYCRQAWHGGRWAYAGWKKVHNRTSRELHCACSSLKNLVLLLYSRSTLENEEGT